MSQQVTKEKYSIETLRERNVSYDHQHWLTQKDVDMANNYVELIERTRSEITPQIGDRLVYVTEHGDYYGNALIDSRSAKEGYLSVCEQPYVPFVWEEDGNIRLSVSGGAFHSVNPEELKFLKWTEGVFKDWGHCGACANGSVSFLAKVPLWFMPNPIPGMEISRPRPTGSSTYTKGRNRKTAISIKALTSLFGTKPSSGSS